MPLTLGDDSHLFGSETSEEYDFSIEEVRRTEPRVSPLTLSLSDSLFRSVPHTQTPSPPMPRRLQVKPTTKSLWSSLHTSLFAKKKLVDGELVLGLSSPSGGC